MKYIDAARLRAKIEQLLEFDGTVKTDYYIGKRDAELVILSFLDSLQQEQPEVDLEKLGEITRHLIAVKDHEEDMRLTNDEWLLLERIGYPERFNARKEDK